MKNLTTNEAMREEEITKIRVIQHTVKVQRRFLNDALKDTDIRIQPYKIHYSEDYIYTDDNDQYKDNTVQYFIYGKDVDLFSIGEYSVEYSIRTPHYNFNIQIYHPSNNTLLSNLKNGIRRLIEIADYNENQITALNDVIKHLEKI